VNAAASLKGVEARQITAGLALAAGGTRRSTATLMLLTIVAASLAAFTMRPAAGQVPADAVLEIRMPFQVTVGDTNRTGQLQILNPSAGSTTIDSIRFAPACASTSGDPRNPCATAELGVIVLTGATGSAGACAGTSFAAQGPDATGTYTLTPSVPVTLVGGSGPTSGCVIDFTFDVLRAPTQDIAPGVEHAQTGVVLGVVLNSGTPDESSGSVTGTLTVVRAVPTVATQASPSVPLGGSVSDTATVTGVPSAPPPTGVVEFILYGPDDPTCVRVEASGLIVPLVNGQAQSPPVQVNQTGLYRWVAVYQGDANYFGRTTACEDPNEDVVVTQGTPTLTTQASPSVPVGGSIFDTATVTGVSGGPVPTGSVSFRLYDGVECVGPDVGAPEPVPLVNGVAQSQPFTTTHPGPYRFVALYSGDTNYVGALSLCDDPAEQVVVVQATPTITTQASPSVPVGGFIFDTATVTGVPGGPVPTGSVIFRAFGPDDTGCIGPAFAIPIEELLVNGVAESSRILVSQSGTYRFVALYSGDANYAEAETACDDPAEQVVVTAALPTIVVDKTVNPTSLPEPGGAFTFGVVVTNTSDETLTITSLTDNRYGDLATRPGSTCGALIGTVLAAGASSAPCTFTGTFTGNAGAFETDVVTATARNGEGTTASATGSATVFITNAPP